MDEWSPNHQLLLYSNLQGKAAIQEAETQGSRNNMVSNIAAAAVSVMTSPADRTFTAELTTDVRSDDAAAAAAIAATAAATPATETAACSCAFCALVSSFFFSFLLRHNAFHDKLRSVRGSEGKRVAGNRGSFLHLAGDVLHNRPAAGGRRSGGIGRPTWEILDHGLMGRRNGFRDFKSGETP
nr:hypothetical protein Itr_chr13CG02530 [Ipomoea trifida]